MSGKKASVVLVHGAWADGSSWAKVIGPLVAEGLEVVAAPLPLTSFADDVAALDRALERVTGPVVLVGHAYAGAVIAAIRDEMVKALVYVAALAPEEGETVADVFYRATPHPHAPTLVPDSHGLIYLPRDAFAAAFAQHARADEQGAAGRRPAADFSRVHHGRRGSAALEGSPDLVSGRRAGSHDRPRKPALHGGADARPIAIASRRSHPPCHRSGCGHRHHPRGGRRGDARLSRRRFASASLGLDSLSRCMDNPFWPANKVTTFRPP